MPLHTQFLVKSLGYNTITPQANASSPHSAMHVTCRIQMSEGGHLSKLWWKAPTCDLQISKRGHLSKPRWQRPSNRVGPQIPIHATMATLTNANSPLLAMQVNVLYITAREVLSARKYRKMPMNCVLSSILHISVPLSAMHVTCRIQMSERGHLSKP